MLTKRPTQNEVADAWDIHVRHCRIGAVGLPSHHIVQAEIPLTIVWYRFDMHAKRAASPYGRTNVYGSFGLVMPPTINHSSMAF